MYALDTDHMSTLERGGALALALTLRLSAVPETDVVTTIVTYEEQCKGWLGKLHRAKDGLLVSAYQEFAAHLQTYKGMIVLDYTDHAHAIFQQMRKIDKQIGTQDLKIAAIALANDATVLTRNTRDFSRVPGLRVEDWTS